MITQTSMSEETYCVHFEGVKGGRESAIGVVGNFVRQCFSKVAGRWKWSDH